MIPATFLVLVSAFLGVEGAPDTVEIYDSDAFLVQRGVFASDSTVYVLANDGTTAGGAFLANVTDEMFGDLITVWIFDDGNGPGDAPNDGFYTGSFTIVDDGGVSGQYTDDVLDVLDLMDGTAASVSVDLDMIGDSGFAMVTADFKEPTVNITSPPDTVDQHYTLTATVNDVNPDTNAVRYTVDGGQTRQMAWLGADSYEALVDTSSLIEGSHTIRVVAYDVADNVNNSQIVVIDVHHPAPDISIVFTMIPTEPRARDSVVFEITLDNSGDADADDVRVSLRVDGAEVDNAIQTVGAGQTETVVLTWRATEGSHEVEIEVTDGGARLASTPVQLFDVGSAPYDPIRDPLVQTLVILGVAVILIGGTVAGAYYGKELIIGQKNPSVPAEEVPVVPPVGEDPCEEIRWKWRTMVAEYERAREETEASRQRAESLREKADREWKEADEAKKDAEGANKSVLEAEREVEEVKKGMSDYFSDNLILDSISVNVRQPGLDSQMAYFKGMVTLYFRNGAYENIISRYIDEHKKDYDELQDSFDEAEEGLRKAQSDAAVANQKVAQAEMEARKAENLARQAEQEHEILKQEVENLREQAESFRQRWRMCNLKRLSNAVERAESALESVSEAERGAQAASTLEEYENYKNQAEEARSRSAEAKEDAEAIKSRLGDEGMDEDLDEYDDRMGRALNDIGSILERILGIGLLFRPEAGKLGQPCKGKETIVLDEFVMSYQTYDPTRDISMPDFYESQSGGEAGEALAEFIGMIARINASTRDVIDESPEGGLVGVPDDYWPTMMDAGKGSIKKNVEKEGGLGFVRTGGLAIPTIQVTITCREVMECKDGTWQNVAGRSSVDSTHRSELRFPKDASVPYIEAVEWISTRLGSLRDQQSKLKEALCA